MCGCCYSLSQEHQSNDDGYELVPARAGTFWPQTFGAPQLKTSCKTKLYRVVLHDLTKKGHDGHFCKSGFLMKEVHFYMFLYYLCFANFNFDPQLPTKKKTHVRSLYVSYAREEQLTFSNYSRIRALQ